MVFRSFVLPDGSASDSSLRQKGQPRLIGIPNRVLDGIDVLVFPRRLEGSCRAYFVVG